MFPLQTYDGLGRLAWQRDERGNETTVQYDQFGRVTSQTLPSADVVTVKAGKAQTVTVSAPLVTYEYDDSGHPTRLSYQAGSQSYTTDIAPNSLGWTLGVTKYVTDPDSQSPESIRSEYAYDQDGRTISEYDALDLAKNPSDRRGLQWTYTARGKVKSETDRSGATTSYSYDLDDNLVSVTDPMSNTAHVAYDDLGRALYLDLPSHDGSPSRSTVNLAYDPHGNLITRTNPDGTRNAWTYSPRNLAEVQKLLDASGATTLSSSSTYDDSGYEQSQTQGGLYATTTQYDSFGRLIKASYADGGVESALYSSTGDLHQLIDANGNKTTYAYDLWGRMTSETNALGKSRSYGYDALGRLATITDALGRTALYQNDELGRIIEETRANGAAYDYRYDPVGNLIHTTDPMGTQASYEYSPTYQVSGITKTRGSQTGSASYSYDPNGTLTSATMDGVSASYTVNAYGETLSVTRAGAKVSYGYDAAGKVTSVGTYDGATTLSSTTYSYQGSALLQSVSGWATAFTWNQAGQLTAENLANGTTESQSYDSVGRLAGIAYAGTATGPVSLPTYSFGYDKTGNMTTKNGGKYEYDALNRLMGSTETGPFVTKKNVRSWTAGTDYGGTQQLAITETGAQITLDAGSTSVGAQFTKEIEVLKVDLNPTVAGHRVKAENLEVYLDDGSGFVKTAAAATTIQSDGTIEVSFAAAIRATAIKVHCLWDERNIDYSIDPSKASFTNDTDSILTITYLERSRGAVYRYDDNGNRTSEILSDSVSTPVTEAYSYWAGTDRMKIVGNWAYTYDADGNLIEKGNSYTLNADGTISYSATEGEYWSYGYDLWNRMTAVSKSTSGTGNAQVVASFQYDPESLRIGKTTPTASYRYSYGIDGKVLAEQRTSGSDTRLRTYVYAAGKLLGYDETINGTKKRYWTCTDQLGSVTAETDSTGAVVGKKEYADFGAAGLSETQSGTHESLTWYAGHEYDPDADLVYSNYRWYDPQTGCFTTEDPIGAGENWYSYCGANPMTHVDQWGLRLGDTEEDKQDAASNYEHEAENRSTTDNNHHEGEKKDASGSHIETRTDPKYNESGYAGSTTYGVVVKDEVQIQSHKVNENNTTVVNSAMEGAHQPTASVASSGSTPEPGGGGREGQEQQDRPSRGGTGFVPIATVADIADVASILAAARSSLVEVDPNRPAVVVTYSGVTNVAGAQMGTAVVFPASSVINILGKYYVNILDKSGVTVPIVFGGGEDRALPLAPGTYRDIRAKAAWQSPKAWDKLTDAQHGGGGATYYPIPNTDFRAIHQANNAAISPYTSYTNGCIGVTGYRGTDQSAQSNFRSVTDIVGWNGFTLVVRQ